LFRDSRRRGGDDDIVALTINDISVINLMENRERYKIHAIAIETSQFIRAIRGKNDNVVVRDSRPPPEQVSVQQ